MSTDAPKLVAEEPVVLTHTCESIYPGNEHPGLGKIRCTNDAGHDGEHYSIPIEVFGEVRVFVWTDVIRMKYHGDNKGVEGICDCGWSFGPELSIPGVATECMGHAKDRKHLLRPHA